jgi:hypothetical protein
MTIRVLLIIASIGFAPLTAAAQGTTAPQSPQGPMTIERVHDEFVVAPEFKVTDLHGETGQIVGVSGGRLFDKSLLVGAGGYWMFDASRATDMGYGGLIVEWRQRADHLVGYSVRNLAGFGRATRALTVSTTVRRDGRNTTVVDRDVRFRQDFFIVEPEGDVVLNLGERFHLFAGIGYRATSAGTRGVSSLNGATASIRLQVGR